jgi:hypothetical protein
MKNLALILIAFFGLSTVTFAQTEKPKLDPKGQPLKTEKKVTKKKVAAAKKETPAPATSKKAN